MQVSASGGADINAFNYIVNYARAGASGGADVNIYVNKGLEASASGGADVTYKGNASLKKMNNSKSGDIRHVK
ncbi:putative auto-transporter adhesin, head GIN domain [compost metagenome]